MADQLPHTDPDLALAREYEEARNEGTPLNEMERPLIQQLSEFKSDEKEFYADATSNKEAVWNRIASTTGKADKTPITPIFHPSTIKWAAAAVIVVAAMFSFVYFQFLQGPELLAQSNTAIETVTLSDGSKITLRPHSKLFAVEKTASSATYKVDGEGYFNVTHNPDRTFSVKTENGKVSVLGTKFTVSSWGNEMQVYLQKGSIKVETAAKGKTIILKPGEAAILAENAAGFTVEQTSGKEFLDWMSQEIIFNNKPARQVVDELEQQFNITVILSSQTAAEKLTGTLSLDSLQRSLNYLELALNGSFTKTDDDHYKFKANTK